LLATKAATISAANSIDFEGSAFDVVTGEFLKGQVEYGYAETGRSSIPIRSRKSWATRAAEVKWAQERQNKCDVDDGLLRHRLKGSETTSKGCDGHRRNNPIVAPTANLLIEEV
jgi:hypothetical protein